MQHSVSKLPDITIFLGSRVWRFYQEIMTMYLAKIGILLFNRYL